MSRSEIKRKAREQLGGNIFATPWLIAILVALIGNAIVGISSFISFIFIGPITFGLSSLFLKQARDRKTMDVAGFRIIWTTAAGSTPMTTPRSISMTSSGSISTETHGKTSPQATRASPLRT